MTSIGSIHHRPWHAFPEAGQKPARFEIDEAGQTLGRGRPRRMVRRGAAVPDDPDVVQPYLLSTIEYNGKVVPSAFSKLHAGGTLGGHGARVPPTPGEPLALQKG